MLIERLNAYLSMKTDNIDDVHAIVKNILSNNKKKQLLNLNTTNTESSLVNTHPERAYVVPPQEAQPYTGTPSSNRKLVKAKMKKCFTSKYNTVKAEEGSLIKESGTVDQRDRSGEKQLTLKYNMSALDKITKEDSLAMPTAEVLGNESGKKSEREGSMDQNQSQSQATQNMGLSFYNMNTNQNIFNKSQKSFNQLARVTSKSLHGTIPKQAHKFKYSTNLYRKSFFDNINGPNENRFIKFNDMPNSSSKYALNSSQTKPTLDFSKHCSRETKVVGDRALSQAKYSNIEYDVQAFTIQDSLNKLKQSQKSKNDSQGDKLSIIN